EKARLDVPLTPQEQEIATLHENLTLLSGLLSGEALRIVPVASGENGAWLSVAELGEAGRSDLLRGSREATGGLVSAYARGDRPALPALAERLRASLAEAGG